MAYFAQKNKAYCLILQIKIICHSQFTAKSLLKEVTVKKEPLYIQNLVVLTKSLGKNVLDISQTSKRRHLHAHNAQSFVLTSTASGM